MEDDMARLQDKLDAIREGFENKVSPEALDAL